MGVTGLQEVTVVHRDGTVALRQVTLLAGQGELLVVLGPSGCGKSTVLRAIAGLAEVRSGEVLIGGQEVNRVPVERRNVAMVFESSALVPFLDVSKNIAWGLRVRHLPETEVHQRVSAQAHGLRLSRLLSRKPATLSAGEQGRVGIGKALVREPSVFLLDEPLAHLDAPDRVRTRRQIVEAVRRVGVTTLYVTHDQTDALAIADRVALLRAGTVVQVGPPLELYHRPANLFAADFVGSPPIGLLPARLVVTAGAAGFRVGARTLPLWGPVPAELATAVDRPLVLGVRAEAVRDASLAPDPDLVALPATVLSVEHTGPEKIVTVEVAAPPVAAPDAHWSPLGAAGARLTARFPAASTVRPGASVQVAVDVAAAHVFDRATGDALWHPPIG